MSPVQSLLVWFEFNDISEPTIHHYYAIPSALWVMLSAQHQNNTWTHKLSLACSGYFEQNYVVDLITTFPGNPWL